VTSPSADRQVRLPLISYPPDLPVSQHKDVIAEAIRTHQVVIVAGETGSGKTTQLPKICLELGRGVTGQIGHTQPRRIAARAVAERISSELGTELGTTVGYQVRFTDHSSDSTRVKLMTDGILLAEMQRDRLLLRYDTLIIDEAHERSLNIDFILGYLKRLLPARPDLKVIITSATIDPGKFSEHFTSPAPWTHDGMAGSPGEGADRGDGSAPIIEVSGRMYPVEVRYRPLANPGDPASEPRDQVQGICDAVAELRAEGPGDILVFLSGEREIRDTAEALSGEPDLEVMPLYARLSAAEQHRVFEPHAGRRVVLATNVAETSLTVPGIRYVVDPGTARISRYSNRTKVQRLPIEPISQASANQRKGRCGRMSDGICIRLYSEEDFTARQEFTEPEIVRTNLASVVLRMAALDLGEIADFPFVDPPDSRNIADGIRLLEELGALAADRRGLRLTQTGRKLVTLPVDPRLGRMILQAGQEECAREILIITAALSIVDPRERPADARESADALHARFAEPGSDFLAYLHLWDYLREQQQELSGSAFRRMCRREHLHYLRVREWQDLYAQLRAAAKQAGIAIGPERKHQRALSVATADAATGTQTAAGARVGLADEPGRWPGTARGGRDARRAPREGRPDGEPRIAAELADRIHRCVLVGLLSHIGMREAGDPARKKRRGPAEFAGARGARFAIFPDSSLARRPPPWVVAAELVETSRLWARTVAHIQPEWAEPLAPHLIRATYSDPHWDARRGAAVATEKVTLYGLPIVSARQVTYNRVDPVAARDLFIQHALVEGDWRTHHRFFRDNQRMRDQVAELERRSRRRGLAADDTAVFGFYDKRIPPEVTSARHFDTWWKRARTTSPDLLTMSPADLAGPAADEVSADDYPATWGGDARSDEFALSYEFAPGTPEDGVSIDIPLASLNQLQDAQFSWQVPGLREELVTELIRSLPKHLRRAFVPAPDVARTVLQRLDPARGDLLDCLGTELSRLGGVPIPRDAFGTERLPPHLRMRFRIVEGDTVLAVGKDLASLRREVRPRLQAALSAAARDLARTGLRRWDFGTLPTEFAHGRLHAYPALADTGEAVDIALFDTQEAARESMVGGIRRLLLIAVPSGVNASASRLPVNAKLAMSRHPYRNVGALLDDCAVCAADQVIAEAGGPVWDADGFARLEATARTRLAGLTASVVDTAARVLAEAHEAQIKLGRVSSPSLAPAHADVAEQVAGLIYPGFVSATGSKRLPDLIRYLRAVSRRLDKISDDPLRDAQRMASVHRVLEAYRDAIARLPSRGVPPSGGAGAGARPGAGEATLGGQPGLTAVRWLIEELRVSLFAQTLGTPVPVSEKRIMSELERLGQV
jgi:ATP-dependent helicase HrpA